MTTSEKGKDLIKKYESFRNNPYLCPAGIPTIGYGTTYYPNGKKVTLQDKAITLKQAEDMFDELIKSYEASVSKLVKKQLNQNQFDALVSFTYNLGETNLSSSTLLKKVNLNPNDKSIELEFKKWINANKKPLKGLIKRRNEEIYLYFQK